MAAVIGCVNICGCDALFLLFPCVSFSVTGPVLTLYSVLSFSISWQRHKSGLCPVCGVWDTKRGAPVDADHIPFHKERKVCFCFQLLPVRRAQVSGVSQNSADNAIVHRLCSTSPGAQTPSPPHHPRPFWACHVLMLPMSASNKEGGTVRDLRFVVVKADRFGALCGHSEPLGTHNGPLGSPQVKNE